MLLALSFVAKDAIWSFNYSNTEETEFILGLGYCWLIANGFAVLTAYYKKRENCNAEL